MVGLGATTNLEVGRAGTPKLIHQMPLLHRGLAMRQQ